MTKFRTILIILAAVACTACNTPQTEARNDASSAETPAETPTTPPSICEQEGMETVVQVRGIPESEREALADSIKARVCSGALPAASDGIVQEGQAEVRWRRQRIASQAS